MRVPTREIALAPTKSFNGHVELNEPVRVYDTSGPWGDPIFPATLARVFPLSEENGFANAVM